MHTCTTQFVMQLTCICILFLISTPFHTVRNSTLLHSDTSVTNNGRQFIQNKNNVTQGMCYTTIFCRHLLPFSHNNIQQCAPQWYPCQIIGYCLYKTMLHMGMCYIKYSVPIACPYSTYQKVLSPTYWDARHLQTAQQVTQEYRLVPSNGMDREEGD
jgi:hypothetical protein